MGGWYSIRSRLILKIKWLLPLSARHVQRWFRCSLSLSKSATDFPRLVPRCGARRLGSPVKLVRIVYMRLKVAMVQNEEGPVILVRIVMMMMKVTVLWKVYEEGRPVTLMMIVVMMKVTIVWMKMVAGQPVSFLSQGSMDYESCWEISKTQVSHLSRVNICPSTESDPVVALDRTSEGSSL